MRNWREPQKEFFKKFLPWNNTGNRRWDDMDLAQHEAAMMQWHQEPAQPARFSDERFLGMWEEVVYLMWAFNEQGIDDIIWAALDDGLKWEERKDGTYMLTCHLCLYEFFEKHLDVFKPIIRRHFGSSTNLKYSIDNDT